VHLWRTGKAKKEKVRKKHRGLESKLVAAGRGRLTSGREKNSLDPGRSRSRTTWVIPALYPRVAVR